MSIDILLQQLVNALSLGSIYALLSLGLAVVFSVLGLLNFAYGEIVTVTSYSVVFLAGLGFDLWTACAIGLAAGIVVSLLTELIAFRPLRRAPAYAVIFSSFAVSLIIQSAIRNFISPRPQGIALPSWVDNVLVIGGVRFSVLALTTVGIALVAMVALTTVLTKTKSGLAMRAAAEDFQTTRLMGASANRVIRLAFIISGALAAVAGLLWIFRTGSASPDMGFTPLLQAFIAVVLGGIGSLRGAVIGGFALAFIEVTLQVFLPGPLVPYVQAFSLIIIIVILYARPNGFTRKIEERVA